MKDEFNIEDTGKQLPYQVPEGFFDKITAQTLSEAKRRESQQQQQQLRPAFSWKVLSLAASVAVLLVAGLLFFMAEPDAGPKLSKAPAKVQPVPAPTAVSEPAIPAALPQAPRVATVPKPVTARPAEKAPAVIEQKTQQLAKTETLEEFLASMSDKELQQLAAMAEAEEYVYGETIE